MSGVLEQPVAHGESAYGAVVLALDPVVEDEHSLLAEPDERLRSQAAAAALFEHLHEDGVLTAVVTAQPELPPEFLADVVVAADPPEDAPDEPSTGRPHRHPPSTSLLLAAGELRVEPEHVVVVSDSHRLVRAAVEDGFGLVVGLGDAQRRGALLAAGAHFVVDDLAALELPLASVAGTATWGGGSGGESPWNLAYTSFEPRQEGLREALCTLGNGYLATRGAACEVRAGGPHYPGTYLAGVYNRLRTELHGLTVEDEHLVNAPNWTLLQYRVGDGYWFRPTRANVLDYAQDLDVRTGVLTRVLRFRDATGRTTRVTTRRLVSQEQRHLAAQQTVFEAEDWSGTLTVRSLVDTDVTNRNVREYAPLAGRHLGGATVEDLGPGSVLVDAVTAQSQIHIAVAMRTRVLDGAEDLYGSMTPVTPAPGVTGHELRIGMEEGVPVRVEKVVAVATSRDRAISTPALAAASALSRAGGFEELLSRHVAAWQALWSAFAVATGISGQVGLAANLNTFHVLQSVAGAGPDLDAGVPARGLHGEGYRGHIFWDEMFVYPMLTLRRPEWTRALLAYRYRRLDEARAAAETAGHVGAMFPWQSGSDGREETPTVLLNPRTEQWMPDNSRLQHHVGLAVAHAVWQYYQATEDTRFLIEQGAELMVEIARFFADLTTYDPADDRYDIVGVMGPDEFHDGYPGSPGSGLRNNAYTNVMTAWLLTRTLEMVDRLGQEYGGPLWQRLDLREDELLAWKRIRTRLRVPFLPDGVIAQFEGYEDLPEFSWAAYRARYDNIGRLDLILQAEGLSTNDYRLSKQADVLMLLYLFSAEELRELLEQMGYALPPEAVRRTVAFYRTRSAHGSTLSNVVHSWVEARRDRRGSWSFLDRALSSDLVDAQGDTTREGIHLGAMAGSVDILTRCYTGLEVREDMLWFHPVIPPEVPEVTFSIHYRDQPVQIELTQAALRLYLGPGPSRPLRVWVDGEVHELGASQLRVFPLEAPRA
ncbi:trehalose 6-phosphate phosphorylase [Kocuria dechangensis]|uniref:Trehalose 6-phosphate phosphorylase n=1 Tax=Kocuria dechangensis TaxID=1176249 RepID=A0A917H0H9_9MICC|nr:glycosyl hydrolase family 65 protein [Kocuria dechangensis]GGG63578.1 trehalose 6-phosphate phosphorylase [Kocuria dechangensis]